MALVKSKSITLTGQSKVTYNGATVIAQQFTAKISGDGSPNNNSTNVVNKAAYNANIETCRADEDEFTAWIREIEDTESKENE